MRKNKVGPDDSLSWAGSNASDGRKVYPARPETAGQDASKLHEIKNKLDDSTYVDGAVSKIATFLTDTLKKKGKDGR
jgi:hypothetical protein